MAKELSEEQQQQVVTKFKRLRAEMDDLYKKVAEVDSDRSEHEYIPRYPSPLYSHQSVPFPKNRAFYITFHKFYQKGTY